MKPSQKSQRWARILIALCFTMSSVAFPLRMLAEEPAKAGELKPADKSQLFATPEVPTKAGEQKPAVKPHLFATPEDATKALIEAARAKDHAAMHEIFGPEGREMVTGDKVRDAAAFEGFCKAVVQLCHISHEGDDKVVLIIGATNFPFPIPIVRMDGQWFFDIAAGKEEIINRHIGEDELNAIEICRNYVEAQRQYAKEDRDGSEVLKYAQKLKSTPGKKDGLFWEAAENEEASPFEQVVAKARAEGYGQDKESKGPHPFHGYIFKILTKQGAAAPGGAYDYIINGNMIAGFALVAYPENWGQSGIMTLMVNQQGKVYERNLGPKTNEIASALTEYNPDPNWTPVKKEEKAKTVSH